MTPKTNPAKAESAAQPQGIEQLGRELLLSMAARGSATPEQARLAVRVAKEFYAELTKAPEEPAAAK